ncbi:MAG: DNA mismatch repair protein MutS [Deltaproteobacteria bacterium]|nr:DNA mismatch repair protein MutS [Deltaproteobacteria bacterium]
MSNSITPAMRQYLDIKSRYADAILFFRMGDFYEMFFDDALAASNILGIALTSRDREKSIPMCGVPYHAASTYIARLIKEGCKVAICEQVTDPKDAKGLIERAVTRVITPGIAFEDELLEASANNFIVAVELGRSRNGFAYMDASTGEFRLTEFPDKAHLLEEIRRLNPLEMVVSSETAGALNGPATSFKKMSVVSSYDFNFEAAYARLVTHYGTQSLDGFGLKDMREGVSAAGALLHYIKETQKSSLAHVKKCAPYDLGDYLVLDNAARKNLELTENQRDGSRAGTLLELMDRTKTAMGARRLKSWLVQPLKAVPEIEKRLDAVAELHGNRDTLARLANCLDGIYDIERLTARISLRRANPRDLVCLKSTLERIPDLRRILSQARAPLLCLHGGQFERLSEAASIIGSTLVDNPPPSVREKGIIRDGYAAALDELRGFASGGKGRIMEIEAAEKKATGINTLKVGFNRVFGYYIEVTNANISNVPPHYVRKQTLVNAERFITPALKELEEKVLSAEEKAAGLESDIYMQLLDRLVPFAAPLLAVADDVAVIDALASFAQASVELDYSRPMVDSSEVIEIEGGRHPVVEASGDGEFVANDLFLDDGENRIIILTGPNMAGKSTYLRQNALIVLLAQAGSFVPARRARIGVVDRIFTRIGASDDLASGQSTFMVEMNETSAILNNATDRSFIILDEIGRGTSTFDGLSIAWAVVEHLHDNARVRARTLFATHYHELTELSLTKQGVKNYNMAVKEWNSKIIFLRKVLQGAASQSFGIHVARLAGMPDEIIERAQTVLANLEAGELTENGSPRIATADKGRGVAKPDKPVKEDPIREELKRLNIDNLTPLEALKLLDKLKAASKKRDA